MSGTAILIGEPKGAFIVKAPDGSTAFDSRLPTQRIHMTGAADILGPASFSIYATTLEIPFGKTFAKIPYVRSAARDTAGSNGFYPPFLTWNQITVTGAQYVSGHYTNANRSSLFLGNAWQATASSRLLRFVYAVFENPVESP